MNILARDAVDKGHLSYLQCIMKDFTNNIIVFRSLECSTSLVVPYALCILYFIYYTLYIILCILYCVYYRPTLYICVYYTFIQLTKIIMQNH